MNEEAMIYFWNQQTETAFISTPTRKKPKKTATQQSRKQAARLMNGTQSTKAQHAL